VLPFVLLKQILLLVVVVVVLLLLLLLLLLLCFVHVLPSVLLVVPLPGGYESCPAHPSPALPTKVRLWPPSPSELVVARAAGTETSTTTRLVCSAIYPSA
jgi:hypothetical protein